MSSGAWVRTTADALTAVAATAGAGIGGTWAYFRYRREAPDLPRVNAAVSATLFDHSGVDYVALDVDLQHLAGGSLTIERDEDFDVPKPLIEIVRLPAGGDAGSTVEPVPIATVEVLRDQTELHAGESVSEHKIIRVGRRLDETIAYEVTLRFVAGWKSKYWTWCTNVIVRLTGPDTSSAATVIGSPLG